MLKMTTENLVLKNILFLSFHPLFFMIQLTMPSKSKNTQEPSWSTDMVTALSKLQLCTSIAEISFVASILVTFNGISGTIKRDLIDEVTFSIP